MAIEDLVESLKAKVADYSKTHAPLSDNDKYHIALINDLSINPQTSPAQQHAQILVFLQHISNRDIKFMKESGLRQEIFDYQVFHDKWPAKFIHPDDPKKFKFAQGINYLSNSFQTTVLNNNTDNIRELVGKINLIGTDFEFNNNTDTHLSEMAKRLRNFSFDVNNSEPLQQEQLIKDLKEIFRNNVGNNTLTEQVATALSNFNPYAATNIHNLQDSKNNAITEDINQYLNKLLPEIERKNKNVPRQDPKNLKYKVMEKFTTGDALKKEEASGLFSHAVNKVQKESVTGIKREKHKKWWYAKIAPDKVTALREVMSQEFFRLIMPNQPKTRLGIDKTGNYYVLSEEIPGTRPMEGEPGLREKLKSGAVRGLGTALTVGKVMNETDAKLGNMLIRPDGSLVKIDGDWCVSALRDPLVFKKGSEITAKDMERLPLIQDYRAYNWLDVKMGGVLNEKYALEPNHPSLLFESDFPQNVGFRREVNEAALKMLILPKEMVIKFFSSYTNDQTEINLMSKEILGRLEQFRTAMLQNKDFLKFMDSKEATESYVKAHEELLQFKTTKKNSLLTKDPKDAMVMMQQFSNLKRQVAAANTNASAKAMPPPVPANLVAPAKAMPPPIPANLVAAAKAGLQPIPANLIAPAKAVPPPLPANYANKGAANDAKIQPPPLPLRKGVAANDPAAPPLLSEMIKNKGVQGKLGLFGHNKENANKTPVVDPTPAKKFGVK
jgi:hypothetical protein